MIFFGRLCTSQINNFQRNLKFILEKSGVFARHISEVILPITIIEEVHASLFLSRG